MFEKIIGNEPIKNILKQSIKNQMVSHSYLFAGIEGIGKKLIAIEFARGILGATSVENQPDFICIEPDGGKIKIEQIRDMQKKVQEKPVIFNRKVYIINDADMMTKEAQNCLLKTLEEPPEFVVIILISSNENALLTTIKSRCMILHFQAIENVKIKKYLKENNITDSLNENLLEAAQGSIGKALKIKEKQEEYKQIETLIENLQKKDIIEITKMSEILYQSKEDIFEILDYINIILLKMSKANPQYTNGVQIVENTKKRLSQNANYDMSIDNMIFNLWEEIN